MSTPDTTDAPDLMHRACEVMGYHVWEDDAGNPFVERAAGLVSLSDHWNIFGLIVEWIEARGWRVKPTPINDGHAYRMRLVRPIGLGQFEYDDNWDVEAQTLPLAAMRWVCEHGHKIAKEAEA